MIRVLIVEDSPDDAELVVRELRRAGWDLYWERVCTAADMRAALSKGRWHAIISDYHMPGFDALAALAIVRESGLDIPFVMVSGSIGEETAVAAIKAGAHDYLMKDSLARLAVAVERAIGDAAARRSRRAASEALERSEAYLRAVLEHVADAILTCDRDGTIESLNRAARQVFGVGDEAVGRPIGDFLPGWQSPRVGGHPQEMPGRRADGKAFSAEATFGIMPMGDRVLLIAAVRDITPRKLLERQLQQAQRMESVGQLAGGIAHDFNNILTVLISHARFVHDELAPDHPAREDVAEIERESRRAAALVRQLLTFSRRQPIEPRPVELAALIRDFERFLRRVIGAQVTLEIALAPELPAIFGDPGQVEQVLMNLCVNARDALPGGGRIVIEAARAEFDAGDARERPWTRPGRFVRLTVRDDGVGMDAETRSRVFEPFFTTKEPGKGTGLGLAVVYGIAQQHDGLLDLESEPGRGSAFHVYFRVAPMPAARDQAAPAPQAAGGGGETVLLAEDEDGVRRSAMRTLDRLGYKVLAVPDGAQAWRLFEANADHIHIVVSDLVMPGMGGAELLRRVRAMRPRVRVLAITGYAADQLDREQLGRDRVPILNKPFLPMDLAAKVREILDR